MARKPFTYLYIVNTAEGRKKKQPPLMQWRSPGYGGKESVGYNVNVLGSETTDYCAGLVERIVGPRKNDPGPRIIYLTVEDSTYIRLQGNGRWEYEA
jgi:hypothetical protein